MSAWHHWQTETVLSFIWPGRQFWCLLCSLPENISMLVSVLVSVLSILLTTPQHSVLSIWRSFNNWGQFFTEATIWPARTQSIGVIGGLDLWGKYRVRESGDFTVINQTLISRQRKCRLEREREGGEPGAPALSTGLTGRRQRFYCSWQNIWSVTCEVSPFTHHDVMTSLAWLVSVGGETLWQMSSTVRRWVRDHNTEHTVVFTLAVTGGRRGGVRAASAVTLTDWLPPVPASPALYRLR